LKEETVKRFSGLAANPEHYGETDVLKFIITERRSTKTERRMTTENQGNICI